MEPVLRPVAEDEFERFVRQIEDPFGFHADPDNVEDMRSHFELDRLIAVFDGPEVVASAGAYTFELSVPGERTLPAAGVTLVTVRSTHRRRGLLRRMMDHQLDDFAERGEPLAILTASEASIYGRFGYGVTAHHAFYSIVTQGTALARPPVTGGEVVLASKELLVECAPEIYRKRSLTRPGAVSRTESWWRIWAKDREHDRNGGSALYFVAHRSTSGEVDGFLTYRRIWDPYNHGLPHSQLVVDQLYGADDEVEAALWQYAIDHDLVSSITARGRPVDEPLRWRLADARRLICTDVVDGLWLRLVDIPAALAARRYATPGSIVIEIEDRFRPANSGRYLLVGGPDGAEVERTDRSPDLSMDVADLGALYLGGVAASVLHRAGRVTEEAPGATRRADSLFGWSPAPWLTTEF